jgi:hypothetical protein
VAADLLPWNAYPWYINRKPSTAELLLGLPTILRLLELAPAIEVGMTSIRNVASTDK